MRDDDPTTERRSMELVQGLNLLGAPIDPARLSTLGELLLTLGTQRQIEFILRYNADLERYQRCAYSADGQPVGDGCNEPVTPGEGLLVMATEAHRVDYWRDLDCPPISLRVGSNILAMPCAVEGLGAYTLLRALDGADSVAAVQILDFATGRWHTAGHDANGLPAGRDFAIQPDSAYQVAMRRSVLITPPQADGGSDQTVAVGATVQLHGRAVPATADFAWSLLSAPAGSTASLSAAEIADPIFVADQPGVYVLRLIVRDSLTASLPDTVTVTAGPP